MDNPRTHTATVVSLTTLAGDYSLGKFSLDHPEEFSFTAGQYVIFRLPPPKLRHTMSIASPPARSGEIEILQQRVPGGEGSKWFASLKAGDVVHFTGPLGKFTLKEGSRPKVFVATGSGIAPIRSMILNQFSVFGYQFSITLYWGLRHESDIFWQDEFAELALDHSSFRYTVTLSKPTDAWKGARGRVNDHVIQGTPDVPASEFYLCGSRAMITDVRALLTQNGVPAEQIYTEAFF